MKRVVLAHIPLPTDEGSSFCGDTTTVQLCPACLSRFVTLLLVHVQSARKPDKSFCGMVLLGGGVSPMGTSGARPSPAYVSIEQARELISARVRGGEKSVVVPLCPGCEANLERFDEANQRRSGRSFGSPRARRVLDFGDSKIDGSEGEDDQG